MTLTLTLPQNKQPTLKKTQQPIQTIEYQREKECLDIDWEKASDEEIASINVDTIDRNGYKPLILAVSKSKDGRSARILIRNGANVNSRDKDGKTPLHWVRNSDAAQVLLYHNANINARDKCGKMPLHYAKTKEIAELLISKDANVNARDKKGLTPLHWAANKEVAKTLINHGADINDTENIAKCSPLQLAVFRKNKSLVEILLKFKANVSLKDNMGETAMDWGKWDSDFKQSDIYWLLNDAIQ